MIPKKVLIFGGTHGNEWTGVQIVKSYGDFFRKKFPHLTLEFILSNPEAHKINRRFVNEDLNRAFQFLKEGRADSYEHQRAHEIKKLIDADPCFIIDLHTTTANMGNTIIVSHYNSLNLSVCQKIKERMPQCQIIGAPDPNKKYLASQSDYGLIIEVGPVANGVISAIPLESSLLLIEFILEALSASDIDSSGVVEIFEEARDVYYPKNTEGEINAYVHSALQGKDFSLLKGECHSFMTFQGEVIKEICEEDLYPIFVNEAAYYPQQLAFTLCRKKKLNF